MTTRASPAFGTLIAAILVSLVVATLACGFLNVADRAVAYKPLRNAPRLAPLITAIGVSFILQNVGDHLEGHAARITARERVLRRERRQGLPDRQRRATRGTGCSSSS